MLPIVLVTFCYSQMLKRTFDLTFGILALIVALPLMVIAGFMVYLEDGRPILFRQKRVGRNGHVFEMFKIRSMVKDAHPADVQGNIICKKKDDPRVTRVGRLLRRFSLDELPQLFNVLMGTMSLVGPRPELPYLAERYEPWQRERFSVLPGITGWWQINNRGDQPMSLHIDDDLYYIRNGSIWLDLEILAQTVWVVLSGKGSY